MVKLTDHDSLSRETVRRRLAQNHLKPRQKDMWCIPRVDAEYVARMEDVLDVYAEPLDPKRPVVCFDESPTHLIGKAHQAIPASPGRPECFDYEYRRNGVVNRFVFLDPHRSWRRVKVTGHRTLAAKIQMRFPCHRTADDFALCMRELVDVDFPEAERIRVVLDNLSTHTAAALPGASTSTTPAHASWLNMVEIEIGVPLDAGAARPAPGASPWRQGVCVIGVRCVSFPTRERTFSQTGLAIDQTRKLSDCPRGPP
jgi:DDE superfamily endonuclease